MAPKHSAQVLSSGQKGDEVLYRENSPRSEFHAVSPEFCVDGLHIYI